MIQFLEKRKKKVKSSTCYHLYVSKHTLSKKTDFGYDIAEITIKIYNQEAIDLTYFHFRK